MVKFAALFWQYNSTTIDHSKKDGGMYILPEYIAGIKYI
jgi:hypothetical protein